MAQVAQPQPGIPAVRIVDAYAPFRWLAAGWRDFRAHPLPSAFYGACFAVMGFLVYIVFRHAYQFVSALVTGSFPSSAGSFRWKTIEFLLVYLCVGGFFAILVFSISVVSVPMMLDRNTDGIVAVLTSLKAAAANVPAMIVWGLLIVLLVAPGFATWFAGLIVTVPVIGHATWHAYRDLVDTAAAA